MRPKLELGAIRDAIMADDEGTSRCVFFVGPTWSGCPCALTLLSERFSLEWYPQTLRLPAAPPSAENWARISEWLAGDDLIVVCSAGAAVVKELNFYLFPGTGSAPCVYINLGSWDIDFERYLVSDLIRFLEELRVHLEATDYYVTYETGPRDSFPPNLVICSHTQLLQAGYVAELGSNGASDRSRHRS